MAHKEQFDFCNAVKAEFPQYFDNKKVLDIGSYDVNGNNKYLFNQCFYLGCDVAPGRNVDIVCKGHELPFADGLFDVILSTECFEHDMYYEATIKNITRMLKSGGLFFFTCAAPGRAEHGTITHGQGDCPLTAMVSEEWGHYYKNLAGEDFRKIPGFDNTFSQMEFFTGEPIAHDLYFYGIKA